MCGLVCMPHASNALRRVRRHARLIRAKSRIHGLSPSVSRDRARRGTPVAPYTGVARSGSKA